MRADGTRIDGRTHGAWEMIANTARDRGEDFLVVWDEAHRGSGSTDTDRKSIAGISATPERFLAAMSAANRTMRRVDVPPGDVRQSGLLKDRILIKHIAEAQRADNTMLGLAVVDLKTSHDAWSNHHATTGDRLVDPLLIVQVGLKSRPVG